MDSEKLNWMVIVRSCTQPFPVGKSKNPAGSATVPPAPGEADSSAKVPVGAGGIDGDIPSSPQDSVSPEARRRATIFSLICQRAASTVLVVFHCRHEPPHTSLERKHRWM